MSPQKQPEIIRIEVNSWLKAGLIFVLIIALGFVAINQGLGFFYKTHFLKSPCDLCSELNPGVEECIEYVNSARPSYWTPDGWTDPFNNSNWNLTP